MNILKQIVSTIKPLLSPAAATQETDVDPATSVPLPSMRNLVSFHRPSEFQSELVEIDPRLLIIPFPTREKTPYIAEYLESRYGSNYMVFNVSERTYDTKPFSDRVLNFNFPGYPCPPLAAMFLIFKQLDAWLSSSKDHVAVLHCQVTKARSGMVAAGYMCYSGGSHAGISAAFHQVCKAIGVEPQNLLYPTQQLYLKYIAEIFDGTIVVFFPHHKFMGSLDTVRWCWRR